MPLLSLNYTDVVNAPSGELMGRYSAGAGPLQGITLGSGLSLSGLGVLSASPVGALLAANNLSDLSNVGTARGNLGLGSAALFSAGSFQPAGSYLQVGNNLSDVASAQTSRNNILPSQTSNANKYLQTDGTNVSWATVSGGIQTGDSPMLTGTWTFNKVGITTSQIDATIRENSTASTVSVQNQYAPLDHDIGHAWNTTVTAADNVIEFIKQLRTSAGASPTGLMVWSSRISTNGSGSFTDVMSLSSKGVLSLSGATATFSNSQGQNNSEIFGLGTSAGQNGVVFGNSASTANSNAVALGYLAACTLSGIGSISIGASSSVAASQGIAIGKNASVSFAGSTVLGSGATDTASHQFVVGGPTANAGYITDVYIGNGVTHATPQDVIHHGTGGSGNNIAGANLILCGGTPTGTNTTGGVSLQAGGGAALGSGSTPNTPVTVVQVTPGATKGLLGFYGSSPIAQALLATGAGHTVDDVITALQNLGLLRQS